MKTNYEFLRESNAQHGDIAVLWDKKNNCLIDGVVLEEAVLGGCYIQMATSPTVGYFNGEENYYIIELWRRDDNDAFLDDKARERPCRVASFSVIARRSLPEQETPLDKAIKAFKHNSARVKEVVSALKEEILKELKER